MCNKCEKFDNIEIRGPEEMHNVVDYLKEAEKNSVLTEILKEADKFSPKHTNLNEIEKGKPWPSDIIEVYLKCINCGNEIKLFCDTYHGGGDVKIVKPNKL